MSIHIKVLAYIEERSVRSEADKLADHFDRAGTQAGQRFGDKLANEISRSSPKVQKALSAVSAATASVTSAKSAYNRVARESAEADEREAIAAERVATALNNQENAALATLKAEYNLGQYMKRKAQDSEKLAILHEEVAKAKRGEENASHALRAAEAQEAATARASVTEKERLVVASNAVSQAVLKQGDAHRAAAAQIRTHNQQLRDASSMSAQATKTLQQLGTTAFLVSRGLMTVGAPIAVAALLETANVAVTASQSLLLLPAAAAAAAAGIGTLKLATQGFTEAMSNIRDTEKFNESIRALTPNAQQAAISLRNVLPLLDQIQRASENTLFSGVSGKVADLSSAFGPGVQNLTTSIAGSMNQGMMGVANTLLTPDSQASIATVMDNIAAAFRSAAPAAQSFTHAILELTEVGSDFLPGLGDGIAGVAADFSKFISDAAQSGELKKWIESGVNAVKGLGRAVQDVGIFVYDTFGNASQQEIEDWGNSLKDLLNTVSVIVKTLRTAMAGLNADIPLVGKSISELADPIGQIVDIIKVVKDFLNPNRQEVLQQGAVDKLNEARAKVGLPPVEGGTPGSGAPGLPGSSGTSIGETLPTIASGVGQGATFGLNEPVVGGWSGKPVIDPTTGAAGGAADKPTDAERRDALIAGLDPAQWRVDPFAGMPGGGPPTPAFGVDPQDMLTGQRDVLSAAHDLEEDRKKRLALELDNTATQREIEDAKWKELESTWKLQEQQAKLLEKARGTTRDLRGGMNELGAALDPDFGLGKGLVGLAENFTKMLANFAAAPMLGKLEAISKIAEAQGQPTGGHGLLGMMGAQNMMAGLSPLLGRPMPAGTAGYEMAQTQGTVGMPSMPGQSARTFAHESMMPFWQSRGFTVGDHAADKYGEHQNGALDIMVDSIAEGNEVLRQVLQDPNVHGAIFNNQTYGYGQGATPRPYSGGNTGNPTQDHQDHVHALYKPGAEGNIAPNGAQAGMPGAYGAAAGFNTSGATPVFVVNMPGGGGMGGGGGIAGMMGLGGPGAAPAISQAADTFWDAIAAKESSGNWQNADTGNSGHYGGLQFAPETWNQFGGQEFAPMPHQATREQQIAVADRTAFTGYGGAKPQGLGAWEVITNGSTAADGITVNSPRPSGFAGLSGGGSAGGRAGSNVGYDSNRPTGGGNFNPNMRIDTSRTSVGQPGFPVTPEDLINASIGRPPIGSYTPGGDIFPTPGAPGSMPGMSPLGFTGPGMPPMSPPQQPNIGPAPLQPGGVAGGMGLSGAQPNPTPIGGVTPGVAMGGQGGMGIMPGGMIDTAIAGAAAGLDLLAPGAGQAAQTGIKLANRAIQQAGQYAGIGIGGLMETFLPTGGSELANSGWIPRIVGGLAGAKAALPNIAGGAAGGNQTQPPLTPEQAGQHGASGGGPPGPPISVEYNSVGQTEDANGRDLTHHLSKMYGG